MIQVREIRELTIPLRGNVSSAVVNFSGHTVSLVAVVSSVQRGGRRVSGIAFNSIGRFGQSGILRERLIPRVLEAEPESLVADDANRLDPGKVVRAAMKNEKPGGHGDRAGAVAALELAVWDLNAKLNDEPAYTLIAGSFGKTAGRAVQTYAAGGYYYPGNSADGLAEELDGYRALGFDAFKMKVGGADLDEDLRRIEVACRAAGDPGRVAVDANGRFDLDAAEKFAGIIRPLGLRWYEEPGDPLDYALTAKLIEQCGRLPIATGENLFSLADTRNLLLFGGMRPGMDIFQMDAGLSYGLTEYGQMLNELELLGFDRAQCFPHGGHLINLHIAAGLNLGGCEAYPGVFDPVGGFSPDCELVDGSVSPSDAPGFGLEEKEELRPALEALLEGVL